MLFLKLIDDEKDKRKHVGGSEKQQQQSRTGEINLKSGSSSSTVKKSPTVPSSVGGFVDDNRPENKSSSKSVNNNIKLDKPAAVAVAPEPVLLDFDCNLNTHFNFL